MDDRKPSLQVRSNIWLKGLLTGLVLQLAIGPVFVFILNIALQSSLASAWAAVVAVVAADYLFICLAIVGVGKLLEANGVKTVFTILSSVVLFFFGAMLLQKGVNPFSIEGGASETYSLHTAFVATFVLTISSPLTIVFWTGVFASRSIEYSLNQRELIVFGVFAGLATLVFLGTAISILSVFTLMIFATAIRFLNIGVGLVLIVYAILRSRSILLPTSESSRG